MGRSILAQSFRHDRYITPELAILSAGINLSKSSNLAKRNPYYVDTHALGVQAGVSMFRF